MLFLLAIFMSNKRNDVRYAVIIVETSN